MSQASAPPQLDFIGYLGVVWRRKWLVLLLAVLSMLAALLLSFRQADTYVSSTRVLLRPVALNPPGSVPLNSTISLPTEAEVVKSQQVAEAASATLGVTPGEVRAATSVTYTYDNMTLLISYSAGDAASAQAGASAVADAYLAQREAGALESLDTAVAQANEQIASLQEAASEAAADAAAAKPGSPQAIEATNRAAQLNGQIAIWQSNVASLNIQAVDPGEVIVPAGLPADPASPNHARDALRGLLVGLILGIGAALFSHALSRRPS